MSGRAKGLIIVAIVFVLLLVVAGAYRLSLYLSFYKDELIAKGRTQITEGRNAGRGTDNQGCVDQSLTRYKAGPGFAATMATALFMEGCLETSRPTPGFCDQVPKETEIINSVKWQIAQCKRVDLSSDQYCATLFEPVQSFCEKPTSTGR